MIRAHGWTADCDDNTKIRLHKASNVDPFRGKFTFYVPGFNVRGTDLQAHIGLSQLARADAVATIRKRNHGIYSERFGGAKGFTIQKPPSGAEVSSIGFGLLASSQDHRTKIAEALRAKGIDTRPICAGNIARQPFWTAAFGESKRERPIADAVHDRGFQLPNHALLEPEDCNYIAETVLAVKA